MKPVILFVFLLLLVACKFSGKKNTVNGDEVKTDIAVPAPPASVAEVQKLLPGKNFTTREAGLLSHFASDSTIMWWTDIKDTSAFYRDAKTELMEYTLHFINDTAYESMNGGKLQKGTYTVDNEARPDIMSSDKPEAPGIKLRLTTTDSDFGPEPVTFSIRVKGIDEKELLLVLSQELNDRKVVVLMQR